MFRRFFIVGAQRSATTYLASLLDAHFQIEMAKPLLPEPKFFHADLLYKRGIRFYNSHFFQHKPGTLIRGEKSVCYSESEIAAQRIKKYYPSAKIIFILRDPVERAISNYWYTKKQGLEMLPIEEALKKGMQNRPYNKTEISINPFNYLERGLYLRSIFMCEKYFPRQSINIVIYEDMITNPQVFRDLCSFLRVDTQFVPANMNTRVHASEGEIITPKEVKECLYSYFYEHNKRLSEYLSIDVSKWWSVEMGSN